MNPGIKRTMPVSVLKKAFLVIILSYTILFWILIFLDISYWLMY
jgi:hypothetical protein